MKVSIPGGRTITLEHLVMDFNGTIAVDGKITKGVEELLNKLHEELILHVLTSDTYGTVRQQCSFLPVQAAALESEDHVEEKRRYAASLGSENTAAIGNGTNDAGMLEEVVLSAAVIRGEGCAFAAAAAADILVCDIREALELFLNPERIAATLRE